MKSVAEFVVVADANAVDVDDAVPTVNDTEGDEAEADMAAAAPTNEKSFIVVVVIDLLFLSCCLLFYS